MSSNVGKCLSGYNGISIKNFNKRNIQIAMSIANEIKGKYTQKLTALTVILSFNVFFHGDLFLNYFLRITD